MHKRPLSPLLAAVLALSPLACGDDEGASTNDDKPAEDEATGDTAADEIDDGELIEADDSGAPILEGIERFEHWVPVHALIHSTVIVSELISDTEAIVATADGHVGVTVDGGRRWRWSRADERVLDVAGYPGGPYVALHAGELALSDDGWRWRRLARWTDDPLIGVVAAKVGLIAVGKSGAWVRFARDGTGGAAGVLPDRFAPRAIAELNGAVLAWSGKRGYGTADGTVWTELESLPTMGDSRGFPTSAGVCAIAKVGKGKGVSCSVTGTAYGIDDEFIVENRGIAALTRDGGDTWVTTALPIRSPSALFGAPGGPYFAVGGGGAMAISKDGETWAEHAWSETANLSDGAIEGETVVVVGSKGTILTSTDAGANWTRAEPPAGGSFQFVRWIGDSFVASDGRAFVASDDGIDWTEADSFELPGGPPPCDDGPEGREVCRFFQVVTTSEGLPDVRGLTFDGDVGLATGDDGLVAMTDDGGANWTVAHGLELGRQGASRFSVRGDTVVVSDGAELMTSTDAGVTWIAGQVAGKHKINAVLVARDDLRLAATRGGLLASRTEAKIWLAIEELPKGDWVALHTLEGAGQAIYAAHAKGGLIRSSDGEHWIEVVTGLDAPLIDMAGAGERVWARSAPGRRSPSYLLRSDDGGHHFVFVGEAPGSGPLEVIDDAVLLGGQISRDRGVSWRAVEDYRPGVDVGDGTTLVPRESYWGPDRLVAYADESGESERVLLASPYAEDAELICDATSGCWMLSEGVLYRPLASQ